MFVCVCVGVCVCVCFCAHVSGCASVCFIYSCECSTCLMVDKTSCSLSDSTVPASTSKHKPAPLIT